MRAVFSPLLPVLSLPPTHTHTHTGRGHRGEPARDVWLPGAHHLAGHRGGRQRRRARHRLRQPQPHHGERGLLRRLARGLRRHPVEEPRRGGHRDGGAAHHGAGAHQIRCDGRRGPRAAGRRPLRPRLRLPPRQGHAAGHLRAVRSPPRPAPRCSPRCLAACSPPVFPAALAAPSLSLPHRRSPLLLPNPPQTPKPHQTLNPAGTRA